jgi:6-phosphogluconolactonase
VNIFAPDGDRIRLVDTVPATSSTIDNFPAGIALSQDGNRIYLSNRGADSITTYAVQPDGSLNTLSEVPTGGAWPRHFAIVDDLLLVANQNSNSLTGFRLDPTTGVPAPLGVLAETGSPTCVLPH